MATTQPDTICRLCGLIIRDTDSILEMKTLKPPVVHASCAEASHQDIDDWDHTKIRTLNEWAKGMGWAGSA